MRTTSASRRARWVWVAVVALPVLPAIAGAQQPTRRRQAPIEIKGQVPTPQVVTVRPREVPTYSRQVLVPRFFDHDFWPDIQTGYLMVPERQITGHSVSDTLGTGGMTGADTSAAGGAKAAPQRLTPTVPATTAAPGTTAPATTPAPRPTPSTAPPATPPTAAPDTARRTPGTASAPPAR